MNSALFFSFMTSLLICMALIPPLRLLADRFHIMDQPGERKVHAHPVPRVGGIAFAIGACASIAWWGPKDSTTLSVLLGSVIILGFGVWDDRVNLGYRVKLLGQLLAALAVIYIGGIHFDSIPLLFDTELPLWIGMPVTVLFLVAVSNAVNLTDGLDGLAGGLSFLTLAGMAYLAHLSNDSLVILLAIPFMGGLLGFLRYNTYPARIFMGDGGALLLGLLMASATSVVGGRADPVTQQQFGQSYFFFAPLFIPLFILGVPILDTLFAIIRRTSRGQGLATADKGHLHHRLMNLGHGQRRSVLILWLWTALLSAFVLYPVFTTGGGTLATLGVLALGLGLYTVLHPEVRRNRALRAENNDSELENSETGR